MSRRIHQLIGNTHDHPIIAIGDIGYEFRKKFNVGWFTGRVVKVRPGAANGRDRRCIYEDGDMEDLSVYELQELARKDPKNRSKSRPPPPSPPMSCPSDSDMECADLPIVTVATKVKDNMHSANVHDANETEESSQLKNETPEEETTPSRNVAEPKERKKTGTIPKSKTAKKRSSSLHSKEVNEVPDKVSGVWRHKTPTFPGWNTRSIKRRNSRHIDHIYYKPEHPEIIVRSKNGIRRIMETMKSNDLDFVEACSYLVDCGYKTYFTGIGWKKDRQPLEGGKILLGQELSHDSEEGPRKSPGFKSVKPEVDHHLFNLEK